MQFKPPKNTREIYWTKHAKEKMKFYNLSEKRLKKLLLYPERQELGIAPGTIAVMQTVGSKKRPTEIWLMYQNVKGKKKIITAWRYPGKSPIGQPPIDIPGVRPPEEGAESPHK